MELRESTTVTIKMGPFVDKTDGVTPETAVSPTVKLSKNGGTLAARNSATAIAHDADGYYTVELNTTDTNTRGRLRATATDAATHLAVWEDFEVIAANYYDLKYAAPLLLQAATAGTATLDSGASAVDDYYNGTILSIIAGPGAGQCARITDYVGSTKVATLDVNFRTNPTSASGYEILANASPHLDAANGVETGLTVKEALRLLTAESAGKLSGATAGASTVVFRNAVADSINRITATTDQFGNRTSVSVNL